VEYDDVDADVDLSIGVVGDIIVVDFGVDGLK